MWFLDRFSNPLWHKASRLGKDRRRSVATALCAYDFLRQQAEKKLLGPVEFFLTRNPQAAAAAGSSLTPDLRLQLVDRALLGLMPCCRCPVNVPASRVPSEVVTGLPELWRSFVLADIESRTSPPLAGALDTTDYSRDPEEAEEQVLDLWAAVLGITDPAFASQVKAAGFTEAWDWFVRVFVADTLEGMGIIPDKMLFAQARRVVAGTPPHRAALIDRFIDRMVSAPDEESL